MKPDVPGSKTALSKQVPISQRSTSATNSDLQEAYTQLMIPLPLSNVIVIYTVTNIHSTLIQ